MCIRDSPTLVRPGRKRLSCLKAKSGLGRFAPSALPHYYANRPRGLFQRPIVPRKRQEEHNKGENKTRGSEALVTRGVQFNRETLLEDTKIFTDGLRSPCRRFPSLISRWSCQKWRQILSRTGQYRVVPKKEKWTRRQQVVRGVRFTSSERIVHAGKLRREVHQKIGQS